MDRVREHLRAQFDGAFEPVALALIRLRVTPSQLSVAGALLNVGAAALVISDELFAAGLVFVVAGGFDLMDGLLARMSDRASQFGAFLDSTLDRFSEGVMFTAIAYRFAAEGLPAEASVVVLALLGSFLTSYTRARAESLGAVCKVGFLTRFERVVLVAVGLLSGLLAPFFYLLAALTAVTAGQRILHIFRQLRPLG